MSPPPVVKALHILENGLSSLPSSLEGSAFDAFSFQGSEKGFGDRIIKTIACTAHADGDTDIGKQGLRLHHWYTTTRDQNERTLLLVDGVQGAPSGKPSQ
jgi:hypothetical protein